MTMGIEAAPIVKKAEDEILILGGRTSGNKDKVWSWKVDDHEGSIKSHGLKEVGKIHAELCLHKVHHKRNG